MQDHLDDSRPSPVQRIGVAFDWGTSGITVSFGVHILYYNAQGNIERVRRATIFPVPLELRLDTADILQTVWCVRRVGQNNKLEVRLGQEAISLSRKPNGPTLLKYRKFLLLDNSRINALIGRDQRAVGASTINKALSKSLEELRKVGSTPSDLIATAVQSLWDNQICTAFATQFSNEFEGGNFPTSSFIDVVVTRPSMWELDDDHNLHAAFKQGLSHDTRISDVRLADEAHSAIMGVLSDFGISRNLKIGDVIGLADAGGGTCDVVTHIVRSMSPLRLEEANPATGGLVGCEIMIAQLEADMILHLQGLHIPRQCTWERTLETLVSAFRLNLRGYNARESNTHADAPGVSMDSGVARWKKQNRDEVAALIDAAGFKIAKHEVHISHWKMEQLFQPFADKIAALVVSQIGKAEARLGKLSAFYLVGGFFRSAYLQEKVIKICESHNIPKEVFRKVAGYPRVTVPRGAHRSLADRRINPIRMLQVSIGFQQDIIWDNDMETQLPNIKLYLETKKEDITTRDEILQHTNNRIITAKDRAVTVASNTVCWMFMKGERLDIGNGKITRTIQGSRWLQPLNETCYLEESMFTSTVRSESNEIRLQGEGPEDTAYYVVKDDPDNQVKRHFKLKSDSFDPRKLGIYKADRNRHIQATYVVSEYRVEGTWDGDIFEYTLLIPSAGHFDCKKAKGGCPGATKPALCPGRRGHDLKLNFQESLIVAYGNEGTVERPGADPDQMALDEDRPEPDPPSDDGSEYTSDEVSDSDSEDDDSEPELPRKRISANDMKRLGSNDRGESLAKRARVGSRR